MARFFILSICFLLHFQLSLQQITHPCTRQCREGGQRLVCRYEFIIENYWTMSSDYCGNCPYTYNDCFNDGCIPADGWLRQVTVINRQLPGPDIQVCFEDTIEVKVINRLGCSTSVHWHGQHQRQTPYMDGTPMVTQCPIEAGTNFTYRFLADTIGTMFYHSHTEYHKDDGVYGALVVREDQNTDPNGNTYYYDLPEHVLTINDWTHSTVEEYFMEIQRPDPVVSPLGMLVNGFGANLTYNLNGRRYETPLAVFSVNQSTTYRFRVISSGVFTCPIRFSIDGHTMLIIALDGAPVVPEEVDSFVVSSGERCDFVLSTNQQVSNYWIKLQGLVDCADRSERTFQYAVLHYNGASTNYPPQIRNYDNTFRGGVVLNPPNVAPGGQFDITIPKMDANLPDDKRLQQNADATYFFYTDHRAINPRDYSAYDFPLKLLRTVDPVRGIWSLPIQNISFRFPSYPLLTQPNYYDASRLCNANNVNRQYCANRYCQCPHVVPLPINKVIELVIVDLGVPLDSTHPFHLHGHSFRVVSMERLGTSTSIEEVAAYFNQGRVQRKLSRAPLKDTVTVPDGGFVVLRILTDNPGFWLFHCHTSMHMEIGMALVFQMGNHEDMILPPRPYNYCGHPEGGSAPMPA